MPDPLPPAGNPHRTQCSPASKLPLPDAAGLLLVRAPLFDEPLQVRVAHGSEAERSGAAGERAAAGGRAGTGDSPLGRPPDWNAPSLGLYALRLRLQLSRPAVHRPWRAGKVRVDLLLLGEDRRGSRALGKELDIAPDGKAVSVEYDGEALR